MFKFKALFTATLLATMATTACGQRAEAVFYASSDCTGADYSGFIGLSVGACYSTFVFPLMLSMNGYKSAQFYTDEVYEVYEFYPEANCGGSPNELSEIADGCIPIPAAESVIRVL
ncbi:hypothetical protein C8R45DRAFT_939432 [Mycena sanguinolenta]|nr:hypothetical protein C8R45DRAFT_939432 [Mycena sanguinolenta]